MTERPMQDTRHGSAMASIVTIVLVGTVAALCAYGVVSSLALEGVAGAIIAVLVATGVALPVFAVVVRVFRR